jgi:predicted RNA-binding Zn-ribbon protein involved in translation (DUF1610 family)
MFLFIVYAVLVWWGAFHWRRHVLGFASVLGGSGVCVLLGMGHTWMGNATDGQIFMPVFQGLLYPYTALLLSVGLCFAVAPAHTGGRTAVNSPLCRGCGYDLTGLERRARKCPECALPRAWARDERHCLHCDLDITHTSASVSSCPGCGEHPRMRKRIPAVRIAPVSRVTSGATSGTVSATVSAPSSPVRVATFRPLSSDSK